MKIEKVCETCGSVEVWVDALAEWDADAQSWELGSTFAHSWCRDCDADTNIIDQEYKEDDVLAAMPKRA
jgi:hypothetical protein